MPATNMKNTAIKSIDALSKCAMLASWVEKPPIATVENDWKGWLEDRRPASNADPYKVASVIVKTVKGACANIKA